jgi:hypothetical protein
MDLNEIDNRLNEIGHLLEFAQQIAEDFSGEGAQEGYSAVERPQSDRLAFVVIDAARRVEELRENLWPAENAAAAAA